MGVEAPHADAEIADEQAVVRACDRGHDHGLTMPPGFHTSHRDTGHSADGVAKPRDTDLGVKPTQASSLVLCPARHQASNTPPDMFLPHLKLCCGTISHGVVSRFLCKIATARHRACCELLDSRPQTMGLSKRARCVLFAYRSDARPKQALCTRLGDPTECQGESSISIRDTAHRKISSSRYVSRRASGQPAWIRT